MVTETVPTLAPMIVEVDAPPATRSLHRKLAQILYEAERIPKNGVGPKEQGSYPFVQVGDAADHIRKALAEQVITMMPTSVQVVGQNDRPTARGGTMTTVDLLVEWTLTDGESGESITIMSFGAGADTGDKYSGKASTSAMKYALLTGFLLSTGEDSELGPQPDAPKRDGGQLPPMPPDRPPLVRTTGNDGLIGKVATSGTSDFNLRETPDGWILPFRIKDGAKAGQIVFAHDDLAKALSPFRETLIGQRATVWGTYTDEESPPKADGFIVRYKVLHLSRIQTEDWTLPAELEARREPAVGPYTQAKYDAELPVEAESAPLFDEDLSQYA